MRERDRESVRCACAQVLPSYSLTVLTCPASHAPAGAAGWPRFFNNQQHWTPSGASDGGGMRSESPNSSSSVRTAHKAADLALSCGSVDTGSGAAPASDSATDPADASDSSDDVLASDDSDDGARAAASDGAIEAASEPSRWRRAG
jgi:hypothetical protein